MSSFCIYSDQIKVLPYFFEKSIEVELHIAADDDGVRLFGNCVYLFHGDGVDLIDAVETLYVLSIA